MEFSDRAGIAVVIGGTGAVGAEVCRLLAERGSDVALTCRRNIDRAAAVSALVAAQGRRSRPDALDVTDAEAVDAYIGAAAEEFGGIHTLVHAGGPFVPQQYLSATDPATFRHHVEEEVVAFFNVVHAVLPHLRESHGSIVAVTTVANRRFPARDGLSSGAKGGIESLVRAVSVEEGRYGVRANAVGPGLLADGMAAKLMAEGQFTEGGQQAALRTIPLRRFGTASDVAEAVAFFASSSAAYITGQIIDVDGGYQR